MTRRDSSINYDFNMEDSERAVALMAQGINPYNEDEARHYGVEFMGREDSEREEAVPTIVGEKKPDKTGRISQKSLMSFPVSTLENIFYGIHNLLIPQEMKGVLTPYEILAKYFSAGSLKRHNGHKNAGLPVEFVHLVRFMDEYTKGKVGGNFSRHFSPSGGQYERLSELDGEVQNAFVESFHSDYVPSLRETIFGRFSDPNVDGIARKPYALRIYEFLKRSGKLN